MNLWVATRKGLFRLDRGKSGWGIGSTDFLGDRVSMVLPRKDGSVLAALDHGHFGVKMQRAEAGGEFAEIACPAYPNKPEGEEDVNAITKNEMKWSTQLIWSLEEGGDGRLWAGTIPGGLFHSDDGGETWELNRPLWDDPRRRKWFGGGYDDAGLHSVSVHPDDPATLHVGVSCGGVWYSTDGGASWETRTEGMFAEFMPEARRTEPEIQDVHRLARCAAHPDVIWAQHHNAAFRTDNGGVTWSSLDVPPSVFGFAVAAHPADPDTAWFVPAVKDEHRIPVDGRMVVARSRDGGESFELLTRGLPQEHCYDLVYRHALDVDGSGELLAMGSTTGNLWISEDAGDSWGFVSAHLPPVFALRWG